MKTESVAPVPHSVPGLPGAWSGVVAGTVGLLGLAAMVGSAYLSATAHLVAVCGVAVLLGFGWPFFLGIPAKVANGVVIALAGVASAVTVAGTAVEVPRFLSWTPLVVALGVIAVILVQLLRGTGQRQRLESTLGAAAGVLVCSLGAGWIGVYRLAGIESALLVAGVSAAIAVLVGMIRWPDTIVAPLAIVLGGLAAPLTGLLVPGVRVVPAVIVGVLIAAVLAGFRRLNSTRTRPAAAAGLLALGLAPVAAVGSVAYFMDRLLLT